MIDPQREREPSVVQIWRTPGDNWKHSQNDLLTFHQSERVDTLYILGEAQRGSNMFRRVKLAEIFSFTADAFIDTFPLSEDQPLSHIVPAAIFG